MDATSPLPRVWVLLGAGAGGNAQMRSLADALGWPYEAKRLEYNLLNHCPNLLLGASIASVNRRASSALAPPWPDLIIAASRRSAPVALWIRKQSGGRTRLVHLLHAQAPLKWFDLVITTPQYRLPELPNVVHNTGPLNQVPPERLSEAALKWREKLGALPRPLTALIVGGDSSSYELDAEIAARLGREASAHVHTSGGSLLVTTSPRTPPASAEALLSAIDCPSFTYRWRANDPDNPYFAYLALADEFIVTVDSASLLVETSATGKPVAVFEWPRRRTEDAAGRERARTNGHGARPEAGRFYERLIYWGLVKPPRDFGAYHRAMQERGLSRTFGSPTGCREARPLDDMERTVARVRALFPDVRSRTSECQTESPQ
jgi:uncharacterized protein